MHALESHPAWALAVFPLVAECYDVVLQIAIVFLSHDDPFQASMACMQIVLNPQEIIFFFHIHIYQWQSLTYILDY